MNTRKCCGTCQFATMPRQGDLTIADAWECDADMNDNMGTSEVFLNNEKGVRLFSEIKSKFRRVKKFELQQAIRGNRALTKPFAEHPARERFFKLNKTKSVKDSYKYAIKGLYDIALLGIWYFPNYGCVLTTFALIKALKALGKEVLLIDNSRTHAFSAAKCAFDQKDFLKKHVDLTKPLATKSDLETLNNRVDTFIVGSDQLFTQSLIREVNGYTFFLDFAKDEKKKIAYATSMGMGFFFYPAEYRKVKSLLQRFDAVSLRENVYKEFVENQFEMSFDCCIDPVFLCSKVEYDKLADSVHVEDMAPLSAYILDCTEDFAGLCKHVADEFNCGMNIIPDAPYDASERIQKFFSHNISRTISIEEWLHYFKYSDYIITDSFHGLCFSIINRKPFALILNHGRAVSRFKSLLAILNLEYRAFEKDTISQNYSKVIEVLRTPIDYDTVYELLRQEVDKSYDWLKSALS